ncbi:aspartyl protease family protein 1-like [Fagus crenata]
MCFGPDGTGRISFGEIMEAQTKEKHHSPLSHRSKFPTYNVSITQITIGSNASKLEFYAIFDSGTSYTNLRDPYYTFISESFNSYVTEKRHLSDSQIPFEYCYDLRYILRENLFLFCISFLLSTLKY